MARATREASRTGAGAWCGSRCGAWGAALCAWLLVAPSVGATEPTAKAAPPAAELIPEGSRFFAEIDLGALRDRGPAMQRVITTLAPLAHDAGLSAERLRTVVMASSAGPAGIDEPMSGDKPPSWLLFVQDGAAPSLSRLETTFRHYSRSPLKPGSVHGVAYRGNRDLSLLQLPGSGGPTLITGAAGPRAIVEAWQGSGALPLVRSPRAELLSRVVGGGAGDRQRPTALRLWLALTAAMQRGLVEDARLPAVPSELALALRFTSSSGGSPTDHLADHLADHAPDHLADQASGAELAVLARCSDEESSKRLATWFGARLSALASSAEVQLLGLSPYLQAAKTSSDGALVGLSLSINAAELAALLDRAVGVLASLTPPKRPGRSNSAP